jgi:hypothetical protein
MTHPRRIGVLLILFLAASFAVDAAGITADQVRDELGREAVFCEGTYALCTRAACTEAGDSAQCACEVVEGWAMGPQKCSARGPRIEYGVSYLWSSYSTEFNDQAQTLTCPSAQTTWAYCYGARCVWDEDDRKKATCTCPIVHGAMSTLGGNCQQASCSKIWSAVSTGADKVANERFNARMARDLWGQSIKIKKPAEACRAP